MENKINVVINGEIVTLRSTENEEFLQRLARYVDRKINTIKGTHNSVAVTERTRALLVALNMADDYFKAQENLVRLQTEHEKYIIEMGRMQEENKLLIEKIRELQGDLTRVRDESDDEDVVSLTKPRRATRR